MLRTTRRPIATAAMLLAGLCTLGLQAAEPAAPRALQPPMTREVRDKLADLKRQGTEFFIQGDLKQEYAVRRAWQELYLQYHDASDPEARRRQSMLTCSERACALPADQQAEIADAQRALSKAYDLARQGDYAAAHKLVVDLPTKYAKRLGTENYFYLDAMWIKAGIVSDMGDKARAKQMLNEAREGFAELLGSEHPLHAEKLYICAIICAQLEEWPEADMLMKRAQEIRAQHDLGIKPEPIVFHLEWSMILLNVGKYDAAQRAAEEVIALASIAADPQAKAELTACLILGEALVWQKQFPAASRAFERSLEVANKEGGFTANARTLSALRQFALASRELGLADKAATIEKQITEVETAIAAMQTNRK